MSSTIQARPPSSRTLAVLFAAVVASLAVLLLSGCQGVSGTTTSSQFRIIDASPDAPNLDFYQGSNAIAYNIGFGNVTSYIPINPGVYDISATIGGTRQALVTARGTFGASSQYTVLVGNASATMQELIFKDQAGSAPGGQIALRFLDQATAAGAVDIYLLPASATITSAAPVLIAQSFNANSGYINVPSGTYKIVVYPTGVAPTATSVPLYSGTSIAYSSGAARTIILLDQKILTNPAVQLVTAADYDSPSATS